MLSFSVLIKLKSLIPNTSRTDPRTMHTVNQISEHDLQCPGYGSEEEKRFI